MDFTGYEHRCDSEELEVYNWCLDEAEIPIYETHSRLHRFRQQSELDLHYHQPVNEDFSILWSQIRLLVEVIMGSRWLDLSLEQVRVDVLDVVALGQLAPLGHPHVADDVLGGQRKGLVAIAVPDRVFRGAAYLFRESVPFAFAVILASIIKFGILDLDQFIWSS